MTEDLGVLPGGHRRVDHLLGEDHDLSTLALADLRTLRDEAEQEETDASYIRRLLQGRMDLVEAERARRTAQARGEASRSIIDDLPRILAADESPAPPRGLGRHTSVEPSRADAHRRHVEQLVADVDLSDLSARSDSQLEQALAAYHDEESRVSTLRRRLQQLMDACSAEITRRYRDGEADVAALLPTDEQLG